MLATLAIMRAAIPRREYAPRAWIRPGNCRRSNRSGERQTLSAATRLPSPFSTDRAPSALITPLNEFHTSKLPMRRKPRLATRRTLVTGPRPNQPATGPDTETRAKYTHHKAADPLATRSNDHHSANHRTMQLRQTNTSETDFERIQRSADGTRALYPSREVR